MTFLNTLFEPPHKNAYYDHSLRYILPSNNIFVFGSNLAGRHGAGAARDAVTMYGAVYGKGSGMQGQSYAIPTKDHNLKVLDLQTIQGYVNEFRELALDQHDCSFFITAIGTGLAGYKHEQIAPMFRGLHSCWFPLVWKPYLE